MQKTSLQKFVFCWHLEGHDENRSIRIRIRIGIRIRIRIH
jgi:hypothetical protein